MAGCILHCPSIPSGTEIPSCSVTGSSSGIGRAIALLFSAEGAKVVCADIRDTSNSQTENCERELSTHNFILNSGSVALFVRTDVGNAEDVRNLVSRTVEAFGRLDMCVMYPFQSPSPALREEDN